MKSKLFTLFVILAIMMSVFVGSASAQAYDIHFTTSITYVNVGSAATTTLDLLFYASAEDTAPTQHSLPSLAPGAASSLFIGSLDPSIVPAPFQGDAIMQSDQPMLVTLVQIPQNNPSIKNRALSNGFSAGGPQSLIATVLKRAFVTKSNTIFSIQNADSETNTVDITFYNTSAVNVLEFTKDIEPGAMFYVDAAEQSGLPDPFNGSAVILATRKVGGGPGSIVSSVMELDEAGTGLKAFEGVASGAMLFYMPSALCNYKGQNTSYAVQNASLSSSTEVTVTFKQGGNSYPITKTIGPGAKASFAACEPGGMPGNTLGSAVVTSDTTPIIAIGKAYGAGLSTAFNGVEGGAENIALPYVRWADAAHWAAGTHQRTYIAIQNVGADIPAGQAITIVYKDPDGNAVGTPHVYLSGLANGAKFNSTPQDAGLSSFGYWNDYKTAGGAAFITAPPGYQISAIARVTTQTYLNYLESEDYNSQAIPMP